MLDDITPLILTRDEEVNIARTLGQLTWAREVLVVDSLSTDATVDLAKSFANVRVLSRAFDSMAGQSNFGLDHVQTPWVMLLDADFFVTPELVDEIRALRPPAGVHAYIVPFAYAVGGKRLRATLYPPRIVLLHRDHARAWQDGHSHRVELTGETGTLNHVIVHDDRKPFSRFLRSQRRYMRMEAAKLRTADPKTLNAAARIRRLVVVAPVAVLVYTLLVKRLVLDGRPGLRYVFERFIAECMLSWEMLKAFGSSDRPSPADPSSS